MGLFNDIHDPRVSALVGSAVKLPYDMNGDLAMGQVTQHAVSSHITFVSLDGETPQDGGGLDGWVTWSDLADVDITTEDRAAVLLPSTMPVGWRDSLEEMDYDLSVARFAAIDAIEADELDELVRALSQGAALAFESDADEEDEPFA